MRLSVKLWGRWVACAYIWEGCRFLGALSWGWRIYLGVGFLESGDWDRSGP